MFTVAQLCVLPSHFLDVVVHTAKSILFPAFKRSARPFRVSILHFVIHIDGLWILVFSSPSAIRITGRALGPRDFGVPWVQDSRCRNRHFDFLFFSSVLPFYFQFSSFVCGFGDSMIPTCCFS